MTELSYLSVTGNTYFFLDHQYTAGESINIKNATFGSYVRGLEWRHQQLLGNNPQDKFRIGLRDDGVYVKLSKEEWGMSGYTSGMTYNSSMPHPILQNSEITVSPTAVTIDGVVVSSYTATDFGMNQNVVFADGTGGDSVQDQTASIGIITFTDSGGNITDQYVPCLDSANTVCFYNRIADTYIYKSGSGEPIAGPAAHIFNTDPSSIVFISTGGDMEITLNAQTGWTCTTLPSAFTLSTTAGTSGETTITVSASTHTGNTFSETVVFTDEDGFTANLTIIQKKPSLGYTFCERVRNNYNAYVDTGIYPDSATTIHIQMTNNNDAFATGYYSIYVGNSGFNLQKYADDQNYVLYNYGDGQVGDGRTLLLPVGEDADITMNNTGITIVTTAQTKVSAITMTSFTATGDTIHIGGDGTNMTISRCTISKGGEVVGDFFPCSLGNDVGFYNSITQEFLTYTGTGTTFSIVDAYGNIVMGEELISDMKIGDKPVIIAYIGTKPFYAPYIPPFSGLVITSAATLGKATGSTANITIKSSENWTLSIPSGATWLSASTLSGYSGKSSVVLSAIEENTASTRTATITASTANYSATCVVTQNYVHLVDYICTSSMTWNAGNKIDTQISATTGTSMRIVYSGAGIGSDRVIGYDWMDSGYYDQGWRIFNGWSDTNTVDINNSRKSNGTPTRQNGVLYDITLGNNYLYDNINETYIIAQGNIQSSVNPLTIKVDVGSQYVKLVEIKDGETTVFYGQAAIDDATGNVGLYDSISNSLVYNSALTMAYGADYTGSTPSSGSTGTTGETLVDAITGTSVDNDGYYTINGSFTSSTYNSVWVSEYNAMDEEMNMQMEDPVDFTDLEYLKSIGGEVDVTGNTFSYDVMPQMGGGNFFAEAYFFLYDNVNDVISDIYWETRCEGTWPEPDEPPMEEPEEPEPDPEEGE